MSSENSPDPVGSVGGQNLLHAVCGNAFAPLLWDHDNIEPVLAAHVDPAMAEHTVACCQHLVTNRKCIADRRFPTARTGCREDYYLGQLALQNLFDAAECGAEDIGEHRATMIERRHVDSLAQCFRDIRRSRDEDWILAAHDG